MNNVSTDTQEKPVLNSSPDGRLGIIPLLSTREIGQKVNDHLVGWRKQRVADGLVSGSNGYVRDSFIISASTPRFGSGEDPICTFSLMSVTTMSPIISPDLRTSCLRTIIIRT